MPKTPVNYSNTIIYKLVCKDLNILDLYVGSTTDFRRRKSGHKHSCNDSKSVDYNQLKYRTIRENGGWENWDMIEIEKFPCNDGNEARARERYWIELLNSKLNKIVPSRTHMEYLKDNQEHFKELRRQNYEINKEEVKKKSKENYEKNKEIKLEWRKKYYEENKELILSKEKERITCECGCVVRKKEKDRHFKSIKHLKLMETINI